MLLDDVGVARKLSNAYGVALIAVIAMCAAAFSFQQAAMHAAQATINTYQVLDDVDQATAGLYDQNASVRGLARHHQPRSVAEYAAAGKLVAAALRDADKRAVREAEVGADLAAMGAAASRWQTEIGLAAVRLGSDDASLPAAVSLTSSDRAFTLLNAFRAAAANARTRIVARSSVAESQEVYVGTGLRNVLLGGALASLTIMVITGLWLTRTLARPIVAMTEAMTRLAAGDLESAVPFIGRGDELGGMAQAVDVFKTGAIEKQRLERETEAERRRNQALQVRAAEQQAKVVHGLAAGLERLSQGDLVFRLDDVFAPEYEKLRSDFNGAMATLQETMTVVAGSTSAIRAGTGEISTAADDLSRRTEQQAASLEQTASALDAITATVKKTSEGASHASAVVGSAKSEAETSREIVRDAVNAMSRIAASSNKISEILGMIDEIAFQTRLLALNAGVEAARAGDAGRGFAVVALEVRSLAQRSAEAAKEIKALIATSAQEVQSGVDLVGRTGAALERIVTQVTEINAVVVGIAATAKEQSSGLVEVNAAVIQMDFVTQQNAGMVEESTAASHAMAHETGELSRLISHFRTGHEDDQSPQPVQRRPARTASSSVVALRSRNRGGSPQGRWEA